MQTLKLPGAAVAIVRNDSVIYVKGYGVLATGSRTPVNDQTLFEIGSSSKAFTATAVAMMVSDGKSLLAVSPHLLFFPGMAIFLTVLAFVFVGDGLRDALDPKLK